MSHAGSDLHWPFGSRRCDHPAAETDLQEVTSGEVPLSAGSRTWGNPAAETDLQDVTFAGHEEVPLRASSSSCDNPAAEPQVRELAFPGTELPRSAGLGTWDNPAAEPQVPEVTVAGHEEVPWSAGLRRWGNPAAETDLWEGTSASHEKVPPSASSRRWGNPVAESDLGLVSGAASSGQEQMPMSADSTRRDNPVLRSPDLQEMLTSADSKTFDNPLLLPEIPMSAASTECDCADSARCGNPVWCSPELQELPTTADSTICELEGLPASADSTTCDNTVLCSPELQEPTSADSTGRELYELPASANSPLCDSPPESQENLIMLEFKRSSAEGFDRLHEGPLLEECRNALVDAGKHWWKVMEGDSGYGVYRFVYPSQHDEVYELLKGMLEKDRKIVHPRFVICTETFESLVLKSVEGCPRGAGCVKSRRVLASVPFPAGDALQAKPRRENPQAISELHAPAAASASDHQASDHDGADMTLSGTSSPPCPSATPASASSSLHVADMNLYGASSPQASRPCPTAAAASASSATAASACSFSALGSRNVTVMNFGRTSQTCCPCPAAPAASASSYNAIDNWNMAAMHFYGTNNVQTSAPCQAPTAASANSHSLFHNWNLAATHLSTQPTASSQGPPGIHLPVPTSFVMTAPTMPTAQEVKEALFLVEFLESCQNSEERLCSGALLQPCREALEAAKCPWHLDPWGLKLFVPPSEYERALELLFVHKLLTRRGFSKKQMVVTEHFLELAKRSLRGAPGKSGKMKSQQLLEELPARPPLGPRPW